MIGVIEDVTVAVAGAGGEVVDAVAGVVLDGLHVAAVDEIS